MREGQSEESLLAGVFGVSDEVNAPLPSLVSSDAAMRKMFVESDDVSRFGLDREGCMLLSDVSSMAAGSDFERTASAAQRFEVRDESDARNVEVTVGMPVAFTEVPRALGFGAPPHHGPGPVVTHGDGEERVALVVAQPDVEPRPVLLDEVVLQHQRHDLVADLDPLDALGGGDHVSGAIREQRRVDEVVGQAAAEALGLADVDDATVPVLELVGPGGVRDGAGRRTGADPSCHCTGWCFLRTLELGRQGYRHDDDTAGRLFCVSRRGRGHDPDDGRRHARRTRL